MSNENEKDEYFTLDGGKTWLRFMPPEEETEPAPKFTLRITARPVRSDDDNDMNTTMLEAEKMHSASLSLFDKKKRKDGEK